MPSKPPSPAQPPTTQPGQTPAPTTAAHAEPIASRPWSHKRLIGQTEDMEFIPLEPPTLTTDPLPAESSDDPLANVPLNGPLMDRFTIQPGEIEFISVGSIEVEIHAIETDEPSD
jgi:hypothetical protein